MADPGLKIGVTACDGGTQLGVLHGQSRRFLV
jgi:hypothetical protein